jgi:hypothetical protein
MEETFVQLPADTLVEWEQADHRAGDANCRFLIVIRAEDRNVYLPLWHRREVTCRRVPLRALF